VDAASAYHRFVIRRYESQEDKMAEEPATPDTPQVEPVESASAADGSTTPAEPGAKSELTLEKALAELAKARSDAAAHRVKLKELEPLAKKQMESDEAKKDGEQKALERAQAAELALEQRDVDFTRYRLAVSHHIPEEDIGLIGSGTLEEMEANAKRVAALNAAAAKASPPPSDRPVEGLRPGASPEPASPPDDSYPESWKMPWMRGGNERESRIIHGQ
jgi:hypothetical protein